MPPPPLTRKRGPSFWDCSDKTDKTSDGASTPSVVAATHSSAERKCVARNGGALAGRSPLPGAGIRSREIIVCSFLRRAECRSAPQTWERAPHGDKGRANNASRITSVRVRMRRDQSPHESRRRSSQGFACCRNQPNCCRNCCSKRARRPTPPHPLRNVGEHLPCAPRRLYEGRRGRLRRKHRRCPTEVGRM